MEKNEVYDYLAKVYLDKRKGREGRRTAFSRKTLLFFAISLVITICLAYLSINYSVILIRPKNYSLYLTPGDNLIKLQYRFTETSFKKQGYQITLADLNAEGFQSLQFNARRLTKSKAALNLKVGLENGFRENAFVYVSGINDKWQTYTISLKDFKGIVFWSNLRDITFYIDDWNTENKQDTVFIEGIRFLKAG